MGSEGLIITLGRTAIMTVVVSRMTKALGQKEISEIISCVGILFCGVYIIMALTPLATGIQNFNNNVAQGIQGFNNLLDKLMFWR